MSFNLTHSPTIEETTPTNHSGSVVLRLGVALAGRLVLNTGRRMVYTFAPTFSRGLGVPLTSITSLIAVNQASGLAGPIFGSLGDRWGYRTVMLGGLSLLSLSLLLGGFFPAYGVMVVVLFLSGLAKVAFDPSLQAYVGARVPYERRGLAMGVIEMAWAGSTLVGVPLVGLLIDSSGWRAPLFVLGGLAGAAALGILFVFPPPQRDLTPVSQVSQSVGEVWRALTRSRTALGALVFSAFVCAANDIVFVMYGAWLESGFGLKVVALGAATTVIGVAELAGEGLTALLADRVGLARAAVIGVILSTLSYLLPLVIGGSLVGALVCLFLIFLTFEFSIVTSFSLFTEIMPGARATLLSSNVAALSLGRVVGAVSGGALWVTFGLGGTSAAAAAFSCLGLFSLVWAVRHWGS